MTMKHQKQDIAGTAGSHRTPASNGTARSHADDRSNSTARLNANTCGSIRSIFLLVILCAACTVGSNRAQAQTRIDLRTNLLTWAVGSPGLGVSVGFGPRWQVGIDGSYGNWAVSHNSTAIRFSTAGAEARYYLQPKKASGNAAKAGSNAANIGSNAANIGSSAAYANASAAARGLYLGIDARYSHFNDYFTETGHEGDLLTAGILVGYTFTLGHPRWSLDASLGCGYVHRDYERYTWYPPAQDFLYLGSRTRNGFGLTNASVSIAYRLWKSK